MIRNVFAVIAALVTGGVVNMALVMAGPAVVPPPAGVDMTTAEGLRSGIALLQPKHFVFPFLAHALGTLVSACVGYVLAGSHRTALAWALGVFSLAGGVVAALMIPAPAWFIALDLVGAYLPMAWIGIALGRRLTGRGSSRL